MTSKPHLFRFLTLLLVPFVSSELGAQGTVGPEQPAGPAASESPVVMSTFEVTSTQNTGYVDRNSATAFKTNAASITIPQPVMVVTRDMISDSGYSVSSDVMNFAGVADYYHGESYLIRGQRVSYDLLDEMQGIMPHQDNIFVDSYEVVRGPSAVFYPAAGLGGIVLLTTRKPLDYEQGSVSAKVDAFGGYRFELDSTGPLVRFPQGTISYRIDVADQNGSAYFNNLPNRVNAIHPQFQFRNAKNRLIIAFDYQLIAFVDNPQGILTPNGGVYSGAGWREEENIVPGATVDHGFDDLRIEFQHSFSSLWNAFHNSDDVKLSVM